MGEIADDMISAMIESGQWFSGRRYNTYSQPHDEDNMSWIPSSLQDAPTRWGATPTAPDVFNSAGQVNPKYVTKNNRTKRERLNVNELLQGGKEFVAVVKYVNSHNTWQEYDFLCDMPIEQGDILVAESINGLGLVEVVGIKSQSSKAKRWIVDKVDMSSYNARREKERKKAELEKKMEQRMKQMDKLTRFREMAKNDPEMARMLQEYERDVLGIEGVRAVDIIESSSEVEVHKAGDED